MKSQSFIASVLFSAAILVFSSASVQAQDVYEKPNNSWISVSGTVTATTPDAFRLDFGKGLITVEMDDWDWYAEGADLFVGDKVTVYGYIDDDLFETRTIEASSVYVQGLNTYFYASGIDEEDMGSVTHVLTYPNWVEVTGEVTDVGVTEFSIDTGAREVRVETLGLGYDPLDDEGYQQIDVGDRVRVAGPIDYDVFEEKEVMAKIIVTLREDQRSKAKQA